VNVSEDTSPLKQPLFDCLIVREMLESAVSFVPPMGGCDCEEQNLGISVM
jgi:hypothetical protein